MLVTKVCTRSTNSLPGPITLVYVHKQMVKATFVKQAHCGNGLVIAPLFPFWWF